MPPHSFESSLAWCRHGETALPFEIGAGTQRGRLKTMNNQDAIAIIVEQSAIVAVVCDGCATSEPDLGNSDVGARLTAMVVAEEVAAHISQHPRDSLSSSIAAVEERIVVRLRSGITTLTGTHAVASFVRNNLLATILGVVIDAEDAVIFGCGDGLYATNAQLTSLPEDGDYLAMRLLSDDETSANTSAHLRVYTARKMHRTRNVMIATDGMQDLWDRYPLLLRQFLKCSEAGQKVGFTHDLLREFNRTIWFDASVNDWADTRDAHDDRSFVVIRRVKSVRRSSGRRRGGEHVARH